MQLIELWLTAPEGQWYDPKADPESFVDRAVRMGDRIVGHVEQVIEIRPQAIKCVVAFRIWPTME